MVFQYTDPRHHKTRLDHLLILYHRANGVKRSDICSVLSVKKAVVDEVLRHGPNQRFLRRQIDRAWQSKFAGMQVLSDAFEDATRGLVEDMKSEDARIRNRSREIYLKTLGNIFPLTVSGSKDDDGPAVDGDVSDMDEVLETTGSSLIEEEIPLEDFDDE
jgi:hypothetical protein